MLRLTLELIPHGNEFNKKEILSIDIVNTLRKNKQGEHKYFFTGWLEDMSGETEYFNGDLRHDRRSSVLNLLGKIFIKIMEYGTFEHNG